MPAVVRDVEPLVRVGRPRVGALDAGGRWPQRRATPRPTGRTRRRRAATRRPLARRRRSPSIGSNAPVFTLPAWAQTIVGPSPPASAARSASATHAALVVGRHDCDAAVPRPRKRSARSIGAVPLRAGDDADRAARRSARRARRPSRRAASTWCRAAARPVDVRHLAAGHEARTTRPPGRPSSSVSQLAGDLLDHGRGRREQRTGPRSGPTPRRASRRRARPAARRRSTKPK